MIKFKTILFVLLLASANFILAQKIEQKSINLKWIENSKIIVNEKETVTTDVIEGNYLDENFNPQFSKSWKIDGNNELNNYSIENVVYETINNGASKFNTSVLSNEIKTTLNVVYERNTPSIILTITPLIYTENAIKRVVSFELNYSLKTKTSFSRKKAVVQNSVLAEGIWYKFAIDTTGVYKIDKPFLESLGMNLSNVNPKNIRLYGNGGGMLPVRNSDFRFEDLQENAIFVSGEDDSSFDNGDYILFYGKGPHKWNYENKSKISEVNHEFNIYSDQAYYFINVSNSSGKRIEERPAVSGVSNEILSTYHDFSFYEKDEVNMFAAGQQWFGDGFNVINLRNYSIPFYAIDESEEVLVRVRGVAESLRTSKFSVNVNNEHNFDVNFGTVQGLTLAMANESSSSMPLSGDKIDIQIAFDNNGNPSANAFLDYIEVLGRKKLIVNTKQFTFRNFDAISKTGILTYKIENKANVFNVWNVSNPLNPQIIKNESDNESFSFSLEGGSLQSFVALNESDFYEPIILENSQIENQNLHSLKDIDYLIITKKYLMSQAERLALYHRQNSGLITRVVDVDQIYNEFSSGALDVTAIRDFIKFLYDNSSTNKIKYVCLFGDASYDFKDRIAENNNIVPVFEAYNSFNLASSFVTDDYYGMMDFNEGSLFSFEKQDVATGRIPVTDVLQAQKVVDKLLSYYSKEAYGDWRTNITLIADDVDKGGEQVIEVEMEKIGDSISKNSPSFNLKKIYLDAYDQEATSGGNKYPTVNLDLVNQVDKGTLFVNYFGHGGENGWASERVFGVPEIQGLINGNKLPLFVTVTCDFTRFDNPLRKTAGEFLFWNENGGAGSLISTTREIFISVGQAFNQRLVKPLLNVNNDNFTISETLMSVKNQFSTTQRFFIFNFGDPAMSLAVPKPKVTLTKMNDKLMTSSLDTIKALSYVKFEGEVVDENNQILSGFNGEFEVTVFDKAVEKSTLNNDGRNFIMNFDVIDSKVFKGRSTIENGKFSFDFVAPRDLKVALGKGKLSMYASNASNDRFGSNFDITVGGINENAPEDKVGPTVQLFMNDLNFVDGGSTTSSPLFIAVIEDESGINTSITAVDHDIVAIIDGDQSNPIILNDFYKTELDDYKKGKVNYNFRDLEPGLHTITFKVWDTYNNISEATLTFVVVNNTDLEISNVLNYPNPFVNYTEFWFNHNKPNEQLNVEIKIFTVSGKLIKTIYENVQTGGNLSRSINWNGLDDFGSKIGKGVYIYKIKVKSLISNSTVEKFEKLVILQ